MRKAPRSFREARAMLRQGRLMAGGLGRPIRPIDGERVVLFVHGYLASGSVFDPMGKHVTGLSGLPCAHFTWSPLDSFEEICAGFASFVRDNVSSRARLSLVGHSLGGLVARYYLQELGDASRVDRLVTLATPHAGTLTARLIPGPVRRVLSPGSELLLRLAVGRGRVGHVPHTAIVAGLDRVITPPASAAALPDARVVWFHDIGHNEMLFDPRVHDAVAGALGP